MIITIAAYAAVLSSRSASAAEKAVEASHKAREGQIVVEIIETYGSAKMLNAMMYLVRWVEERENKRINWLDEFRDARRDSSRYNEIKEVDECRRIFLNHYDAIDVLKDQGLLSKKIVKSLRSVNQERFYKTIVRPLTDQIEVKVTEEWPTLTVNYQRRIRGTQSDGQRLSRLYAWQLG